MGDGVARFQAAAITYLFPIDPNQPAVNTGTTQHQDTAYTLNIPCHSDWYLGLVLFLFPVCCGDKFPYSLK